ncbi:DegT/DnrJ/EryC1/StrS family aminotransferase [Chitinimonas lacunae]|uniref:DegT/DnrJ/EryC1/StrS family aminotransferase n=1 Tax=Chitinimonas lacunae TaxID=1963018 RepID=A0ABV8MPN5_9NEIS
MTKAVPLLVPKLPDADALLPYLRQIDQNRWYTNFGPLARLLEERLAGMFMREPAPVQVVSVSSGTAGLELALAALQLKPGSRILVPALTFVASATAILGAGHVPLICDIDPHSWLLTPEIARQVLNETSFDAVMPVSTFGAPQPVGGWDAFTAETGIPVVIDAAGAFGNQTVGLTTRVVFSLHATKALASGEGGIVLTRQYSFAEKVRQLSNFGIDFSSGGLVFNAGENGKLSEYHAAVGLASLDQWDHIQAVRLDLQQRYQAALAQYCPRISLQQRPEQGIYPILVVCLPQGLMAREIQSSLLDHGIESRQWYCPTIDMHPAFAAYRHGELGVSHNLSRRLLGLPYFIDMQDEQIAKVCQALGELTNSV